LLSSEIRCRHGGHHTTNRVSTCFPAMGDVLLARNRKDFSLSFLPDGSDCGCPLRYYCLRRISPQSRFGISPAGNSWLLRSGCLCRLGMSLYPPYHYCHIMMALVQISLHWHDGFLGRPADKDHTKVAKNDGRWAAINTTSCFRV
jgi:hypothetical protein